MPKRKRNGATRYSRDFRQVFSSILEENEEKFKELIQNGVINELISHDLVYKCMECVIQSNNWNIMKLFLTEVAKLEQFNKIKGPQNMYNNETLLMRNVNFPERIKFLLDLGEDLHYVKEPSRNSPMQDGGGNALTYAVRGRAPIESVKILIENKIDLSVCGSFGLSPLMYACENSNLEMVKLLVKSGADVNATRYVPFNVLEHAIFNHVCSIEIIKFLLESIRNINISELLNFASTLQRDGEVINLLLKYNANVNHVDPDGNTALIYATETRHNLETMKILIDAGINIETKNKIGHTALTHAIDLCPENVKDVLSLGANPNVCNNLGKTALMEAVSHGDLNTELLDDLIDHGANVDAKCFAGKTALMYTALTCDDQGDTNARATEVVIHLLDRGANLNVRDSDNNTALYYTATADIFCKDVIIEFLKVSPELLIDSNPGPDIFYSILKYCLVNRDEEFLEFVMNIANQLYDNNYENDNEWKNAPLNELVKNFCLLDMLKHPKIFKLILNSPLLSAENYTSENNQTEKLDPRWENISECLFKDNIFITFKYLPLELVHSHGIEMHPTEYKNRFSKCSSDVKYCWTELLKYGFQICPKNNNSVSPVTYLMYKIFKMSRSFLFSCESGFNFVKALVQFLIINGTHVNHRAIRFDQQHPLHYMREKYDLPDALWMAATTGYLRGIKMLLPYWPHPPLALAFFVLTFSPYNSVRRFASDGVHLLLSEYGPLPIGSELYTKTRSIIVHHVSEMELPENFVDRFDDLHAEIPSLLSLCRIAVRGSLPPGRDLPQRLCDLVPHGLKDYLNYVKPVLCFGKKQCDEEELVNTE